MTNHSNATVSLAELTKMMTLIINSLKVASHIDEVRAIIGNDIREFLNSILKYRQEKYGDPFQGDKGKLFCEAFIGTEILLSKLDFMSSVKKEDYLQLSWSSKFVDGLEEILTDSDNNPSSIANAAQFISDKTKNSIETISTIFSTLADVLNKKAISFSYIQQLRNIQQCKHIKSIDSGYDLMELALSSLFGIELDKEEIKRMVGNEPLLEGIDDKYFTELYKLSKKKWLKEPFITVENNNGVSNNEPFSMIQDGFLGCGKCLKQFDCKVPLAINLHSNPEYLSALKDLSLITAKCPHCGFEATIPIMFIFHYSDKKILWIIVSSGYLIRYQKILDTFSVLSKYYMQNLNCDEKKSFNSLTPQIVPLSIFLMLIGSEHSSVSGFGSLHFIPNPQLKLPEKGMQIYSDVTNYPIHYGTIYFSSGEYSDFYKSFVQAVKIEINRKGIHVHPQDIDIERKPIGTFGIPDILIYIGSTIIFPLILGVIGNLLSDLLFTKSKSDQNAENNSRIKELFGDILDSITEKDIVRFYIRIDDCKREYVFEDNLEKVSNKMRECRNKLLRTIRIQGDCHVANYIGNMYIDNSEVGNILGKEGEINNISYSDSYGKYFSKTTRVRITEDPIDDEQLNASMYASMHAREFMKIGKYNEAILILEKHLRDDKSSIEVLYNYAICLEKLGRINDALNVYEKILISAINLPSLEDVKNIITGIPLKNNEING